MPTSAVFPGRKRKKCLRFAARFIKKESRQDEIKDLPYVIKNEAKALLSGRFDLWEKQGKLFQLMN